MKLMCSNQSPHEPHLWKWRQEQFRWETLECEGRVFTGCDCDAYDGDHSSRCAIYVQTKRPLDVPDDWWLDAEGVWWPPAVTAGRFYTEAEGLHLNPGMDMQ